MEKIAVFIGVLIIAVLVVGIVRGIMAEQECLNFCVDQGYSILEHNSGAYYCIQYGLEPRIMRYEKEKNDAQN